MGGTGIATDTRSKAAVIEAEAVIEQAWRHRRSRHRRIAAVIGAILIGVVVATAGGALPPFDRTISHGPNGPGIVQLPESYSECPGQLTANAATSADVLPAASSHTDDRGLAQRSLAEGAASIQKRYPGISSIVIAPGDGFVWTLGHSGTPVVVSEHDFTFEVLLDDPASCPDATSVNAAYSGFPLTFMAPTTR